MHSVGSRIVYPTVLPGEMEKLLGESSVSLTKSVMSNIHSGGLRLM
jgi:hypothetical protein